MCVCQSLSWPVVSDRPLNLPLAGDVESDGIKWPRCLATPGPCWLSTVFVCSSARGPASLIVFCLTQGGWLNLNQLQTSSCLASGNQLNPPPKLNRCLESPCLNRENVTTARVLGFILGGGGVEWGWGWGGGICHKGKLRLHRNAR